MGQENPTAPAEYSATLTGTGAAPADPSLALLADVPPRGTQIGRYVVIDRLGAGGMGVVLSAYDPELDRKVAVKLLHRHLGGGGSRSSGTVRFLREAQAIARLSHGNVVVVHDTGVLDDGRVFITMELVDGTSVAHWLREPRPWREILDVYLRAGRGLAAAHAAGLVHRDFKPDNVLVGKDGTVRVADFVLARSLDAFDPAEAPSLSPLGERSLLAVAVTQTGALLGTPGYMAPEQFEGGVADERSDQFAFCVALYEALHGERPFAPPGTPLHELSQAVLAGRVREAPRARPVPPHLRRALRGYRLNRFLMASEELSMPALSKYTNVYSTAISVIQKKGFQTWFDPRSELYYAEKDGWDFAAHDPCSLLGVIAIFEFQKPEKYEEYWWRDESAGSYRDLPEAPRRPYKRVYGRQED